MKIRAVIADDEALARQRIRALSSVAADIEIVAECPDGLATIEAVEAHAPDLLFLDVQMPRADGFAVLEALESNGVPLPIVIFTTAFDEHAIRAFDVHALDYLLKPFKESRFHQALERARQQLTAQKAPADDTQLGALLAHLRAGQSGGPRILVKLPDRLFFLKADQVDHIEAAGNYVVVHVGQERHVVRETLAGLEKRLKDAGFMRVSRSAIINLNRIKELQPMGPGEYCVILKSGTRVTMTCSLRDLNQRIAAL